MRGSPFLLRISFVAGTRGSPFLLRISFVTGTRGSPFLLRISFVAGTRGSPFLLRISFVAGTRGSPFLLRISFVTGTRGCPSSFLSALTVLNRYRSLFWALFFRKLLGIVHAKYLGIPRRSATTWSVDGRTLLSGTFTLPLDNKRTERSKVDFK